MDYGFINIKGKGSIEIVPLLLSFGLFGLFGWKELTGLSITVRHYSQCCAKGSMR